eukprot:PhF_6_TR25647/c0_g1_i1/m.36093
MSANPYHDELMKHCTPYRQLAELKLKGWKGQTYTRPNAPLARYESYAANYTKHLLPFLHATPWEGYRKFIDLGCAPGGLCAALLGDADNTTCKWKGVGVTLDPKAGGLNVSFQHANLEVRYADINKGEEFLRQCSLKEDDLFDFANLGIVLDAVVKQRTQEHLPYSVQLDRQLQVALKVLKPNGSFMMPMKWDYTSLPETLQTIDVLLASGGVIHIVPSVYTADHGRKQFYLLTQGITVTKSLVESINEVWNKGRERYLAYRSAKGKRDREDDDGNAIPSQLALSPTEAADVVQRIMSSDAGKELTAYCELLRVAFAEGHFL